MKASYQWLRSLVPGLSASPEELAARITAAGLEVEAMIPFGVGTEASEIVAVVSIKPHPSKGGLRLVTVERGEGRTQTVVCGAPNVPDPGGLVVLAPLGTVLPAVGMTLERRSIGGVVSEGMLCSEKELGLSEESHGIIVLPQGFAPLGTRFAEAVPEACDTVFEIGLTPNRPDGLGHLGLAREIAALYNIPWSAPSFDPGARPGQGGAAKGEGRSADVKVAIEDAERCAHYASAVVVDGTVRPSPLGVRYRLAALGLRSISNVVDVTNLVMLEFGHPMHAFDLDRIRGGHLFVRLARAGERLTTLDGVDRALDEDDLVICDGGGPVALAGVMGGKDSEVTATTRRVLLECAYFDPRTVRRTARRHGLHSDASHRFERGVDFGDTVQATGRAVELLGKFSGGVAEGRVSLTVARSLEKAKVTLRAQKMTDLLGYDVPFDGALGILKRLGFDPRLTRTGVAECTVPSHRPDVAREVDLIEEVARVRGLDEVPAVVPALCPSREVGHREATVRKARSVGVALGLSEALLFGFVGRRLLEAVGAPAPSVELRNPLTEDQAVMRTSLLPGLLESAVRASRHQQRDVRLFSVGALFLEGDPRGLPRECLSFAAVLAGDRPVHLSKPQPLDVWDAKAVAVAFVERFVGRGAVARAYEAGERPKYLHPRGAGRIEVDGTRVGSFGLLHPDVVEAFDGEPGTPMLVVDLALETLATLVQGQRKYIPIPRFPASLRDMALVVPDKVPAGDVEALVRTAAGDLAERVELFDRFVGGAVPEHHVSLAFRVVYRAKDRTLTDAEVDAQHGRVVAEVGAKFGASLRA